MTTIPSSSAPFLLVGRDRELGVLREHLNAAISGQGSLVLIGGEAGIGKTSVAEATCWEARERGALILTGRCFDLADTPAYGPWVYLFERYRPGPGLPSHPAALAEPGTVGAVASQAALFRQVLDFLKVLVAAQPVVLLLDDLHWSDPASLDLLRFVAQFVAMLPLLLLVTYRSDELTRLQPLYHLLPSLVREAAAARLGLHRLDNAAVESLIRARYRLLDRDITRLAAYLQVRAEGNAFFLGELLRALEETGVLRYAGDGWALDELTHIPVPPLVRQLIDGRFARLDEESQRLLAIAAVIGHELFIPLWATVAEVSEDALLDIVEQGTTARLIVEMPDGETVQFTHALVREALYEQIPAMQRQRIHRHVAETLAATANPDVDAVSYHLRQAGDERAAEWLIKAGEQAHRAWAWPTAVERYETALAVLGKAKPGVRSALLFRLAMLAVYTDTLRAIAYLEEAEPLARSAQDASLRANILSSQGEFRCLTGDVQRGLTQMRAAVRAFEALPPANHARREPLDIVEALDADGARGMLLNSLASTGMYRDVQVLDAHILALAPPSDGGDRYPWGRVHQGLRDMHAALGHPDEAERAYGLARAALLARGDTLHAGLLALQELQYVILPYQTDDLARRQRVAAEAERAYAESSSTLPLLPPRRGRAPLLVVEGAWDEAYAVLEAVLAAGGRGGYINSARGTLAPLAHARGDTARAWQLVRESLPAGPASAPGDGWWYLEALVIQCVAALLCLDAGDLPRARAWLSAHDHWLAWSGAVLGFPEGQALWAYYYRTAGDADQAVAHAQRALAHASAPRQPLALVVAHRLHGELATDAGHFDDAAMHLDTSLLIADACAAPYERALTLLALAHLRMAMDAPETVQTLLAEVRAICEPLNATPTRARAERLEARLTLTRPAVSAYPVGLSAREVEVLRLMAAGQTNREIAAALFLSRHTVGIHVTHILQKTNSDNRAAAASFALRHGLI